MFKRFRREPVPMRRTIARLSPASLSSAIINARVNQPVQEIGEKAARHGNESQDQGIDRFKTHSLKAIDYLEGDQRIDHGGKRHADHHGPG